jgi:hypothetical protein
MTKLISGRVLKVTSANVSADRYQFIGLSETEPDLGLPAVTGYVLTSDTQGVRSWTSVGSLSGVPYFANTSGVANVAYTANIANTVLTLSNFTTANLVEGINLYYTNARVISAVTPYLTTANVLESSSNLYYTNARVYAAIQGNLATKANTTDLTTANVLESNSNLYYTNARVISVLTSYLTTSNVAEGSNLYYTNARVLSALTGNVTIGNLTVNSITSNSYTTTGNINAGNIIASGAFFGSGVGGSVTGANLISATFIQGNSWIGLYTANILESNTALFYTNSRVVSAVTPYLTTANVIESSSNLYYTNFRVITAVTPYLTTANVTEVNNLYYTNSRARSAHTAGTGVVYDTANGIIAIGQNVATTANVQFSNVKLTNLIAISGDIIVGGNLVPSQNAVFNFGSPTSVWKDFYLSATSLFVGNTKVSSNSSTGGLAVTTSTGQATDFTAANIFAGNATISGLIYGNLIGTVSSLSNFSVANVRFGNLVTDTSVSGSYSTTGNVNAGNVIVSGTTTIGAGSGGSLTGANLLSATNIQTSNLLATAGNIVVSANIIPSEDAVYNFGSLDKQWKDFYLSAQSLYVGGQRITGNANTGLTVVNLVASNITTANLSVTGLMYGNLIGTVSSLSNFTTSNLAEGNNKYFTNARVAANLELQSINVFADVDITGITNNGILTWNGTQFVAGTIASGATANSAMVAYQADHANTADSSNVANSVISLSNFTTANLLESNVNLYYTNSRTRSAFLAGQNIIIESNGRISANLSIALSNITAVISNLTSDSINEGNTNFYYTNARVISAVTPYLTTANVLESNSNLYYTNARVRSAHSGGTGVSYDVTTGAISISQNVAPSANVTFFNLSVTNNLTVYGGVETFSANNLVISDNMIYLNNNSTQANPDLGIAFNYNDGIYHHAGFFRDHSDGVFKVFDNYSPEPDANIFINTSHASFRLANLAATTLFGNVVGTVSTLSNFTTSNLSEGTNLYFTNARVYAAIQGNLATKANVTDLTTSNVIEGTNLYFTNARVVSIVTSNVTTSNIAEGSNLYYTNARVLAYVSNSITTGNIAEANVNLYYTNARARSAFVAGPFINIAANGQISASIDASNITIIQGNIVQLAQQVVSLQNQTTSNIAEGVNLYYTNSRVASALSGGKGISISPSGIITNTGSSSQYNTGIDGTVGANVLATMSPVLTFPTSSPTDRYLLRSLHLVNTSGATALVSSNILYATGNTAYMANVIPVAAGGVMEFIKTYQIFQPGDQINLQGYNTAGTATANLMSVMLTYETFYNDNSYMGTGQTIAASGTNTKIYNSANSFSIIESVKFVNLQTSTVPITCYWGDANGLPKAHLAFGLQLPPNSSVELLQSTKRINQGDGLYASYSGGSANGVSAFVSARYGAAYTIGTYTSAALPGNTITTSFSTTANEGTTLYYTLE